MKDSIVYGFIFFLIFVNILVYSILFGKYFMTKHLEESNKEVRKWHQETQVLMI